MWTRLRLSSVLNRTTLTPTSINNRITSQARSYSSASDRKPKSGGTLDSDPDHQISTSPPSSDKSVDPKPIVISGRGRRASHRSAQSALSKQYVFIPKLALPFKPLSSNHLAHLRPTTLFLDLFFSLQRPLLEIEISPTERRSITFESKQSKQELEADLESSASIEDSQEDFDYHHIASGSPSDPAFKPPHPSSARPAPDDSELDSQMWSTSDPYSAYLIAEPDGIHPAWSDALKRCLANSQAFVPPPAPKANQPDTDLPVRALSAPKPDTRSTEQGTFQSEKEAQIDRDRQRALEFLNPYGSVASNKTEQDTEHPGSEAIGVSGTGDSSPLPQDQLSLTMQAARFLHSGMVSNRWPSAVNWAAIDSRLTAAEESYNETKSRPITKLPDFTAPFPPIRGQDRTIKSGRRGRASHSGHQISSFQGVTSGGQTFSFNTEQLTQIIKYSQRIIKDKLAIETIPKSILQSLERFGEFLIHKHFKTQDPHKPTKSSAVIGSSMPIVIIDPSSAPQQSPSDPPSVVINLDSVFRKKKRKMKVHKYKKRRKARRTLKKRQGK